MNCFQNDVFHEKPLMVKKRNKTVENSTEKQSNPISQLATTAYRNFTAERLEIYRNYSIKENLTTSLNLSRLYWVARGRLRNQIFEFATAFCTALQSNHTPTIPLDSSLTSLFQIPDAIRVKQKNPQHAFSERKCCFMQPHILEMAKAYPQEEVRI